MTFEKPEKSEFWKNEKKLLDIFHTWIPQTTIIWGTFPEIRNEIIFFHFGSFFSLYPSPPLPYNPENQNFKKMKKASGDVIILNLCNKKTQSYDVCLLWYGVRQTQFFVILGHFLHFYPTIDTKNEDLEKIQKTTYPFTHADHKWWYDVWFLRYRSQQTEFFVISDYFLPFYPL